LEEYPDASPYPEWYTNTDIADPCYFLSTGNNTPGYSVCQWFSKFGTEDHTETYSMVAASQLQLKRTELSI